MRHLIFIIYVMEIIFDTLTDENITLTNFLNYHSSAGIMFEFALLSFNNALRLIKTKNQAATE